MQGRRGKGPGQTGPEITMRHSPRKGHMVLMPSVSKVSRGPVTRGAWPRVEELRCSGQMGSPLFQGLSG
jgi:hypothetical protein